MSNDGVITSEEEYHNLSGTYRSEGFGVYLRLVDASIGTLYSKVIDGKTSDSDVVKFVNQIKGLTEAKNLCFNALKENEYKYKKD